MVENQPVIAQEKGKSEFERLIEEHFGMSVEEIRKMPLEEMRVRAEAKLGRPLQPISGASCIRNLEPSIKLVSHEEVERQLDEALK